MSEPAPAPAPQTTEVRVQVRDEKAHAFYANYVNLSGGPNAEDLILHFATQFHSPERQDTVVMDINARVALNFYNAKRLALMLSQAVQRYEAQFGVVEIDPRRRMKQA